MENKIYEDCKVIKKEIMCDIKNTHSPKEKTIFFLEFISPTTDADRPPFNRDFSDKEIKIFMTHCKCLVATEKFQEYLRTHDYPFIKEAYYWDFDDNEYNQFR